MVVSTPAQTVAALKTPGTVVLLKPGRYDGLALKGLRNVTLASADPSHPAVIGPFRLSMSAGVTFRQVEFSSAGYSRTATPWGWTISDTSGLTLDRVFVHGDLTADPQTQTQGVTISRSKDVRIEGGQFSKLYRGLAVNETQGLMIKGVEFHDTARTAFVGANVQGAQITDNRFHDFHPIPGDHMDAIAFNGSGEGNTTADITIARNVIWRGQGKVAQGIFFRDSSDITRFNRLTITDNLVVCMGINGLTVIGAQDVKIERNTVLSCPPEPGNTQRSSILVLHTIRPALKDNAAVIVSVSNRANQNTGWTESGSVKTAPVTDGGKAARDAMALKPF